MYIFHKTLIENIRKDNPKFVESIPPNEESHGLYMKVRHIYKNKELAGNSISKNEMDGIIELALEDNVKNKIHWLNKVLSKSNIKKTLSNIRELMSNMSAAVKEVVKIGVIKTKEQIRCTIWFSKFLSMDKIISLAEKSLKKKDSYHWYMNSIKKLAMK